MIIYPAIDLRGGKVVRLVEGDPNRQTIHGDDPLEVAKRWQDANAEWLHVVNLDGALGEAALNLSILEQIATIGLPIEFGGGLRSLNDVQSALNAGAARVVLGTMVVQNPALAGEAVEQFGAEAVAVALDARHGKVATHGWQQESQHTPTDLGQTFAEMGVVHALYTDISRDGNLKGVNVEATSQLAKDTGLSVIASGGVASLDDIKRLKAARNIAGVVIGKALYTGAIQLSDVFEVMEEGTA